MPPAASFCVVDTKPHRIFIALSVAFFPIFHNVGNIVIDGKNTGDMNKLEQKLVVELTALPNVRWWHRNIARQGFAINGFIKHYPDILIMTQSGKLICAETKGEHLKNDDSREKIALGQAWRTAAGKDFRYYMVFENEENLLPGAVSMSQFIDTVKAL